MNQKHHHLIISVYALLVLAAPIVWAPGANAQVACPAGYTCTPAASSGGYDYLNANNGYYSSQSQATSIKVTYPQVGASLANAQGKPIADIRWTNTGTISSVGILLTGINGFQKVLTTSAQNLGSFSWASDKDIPTGLYQIQVYNPNKTAGTSPGSSGIFTLTNSFSAATSAASPFSASCSGYTGSSEDSVSWNSMAIGGKGPYSYSWTMYNDPSYLYAGNQQSYSLAAVYRTPGTKWAYVQIRDANGNVSSASCSAAAKSAAAAAVAPQVQPAAAANGQAASPSSNGFSLSCYGSASFGRLVTWVAQSSFGKAPYSYIWSMPGASGDASNFNQSAQYTQVQYSSSGQKQASVKAVDILGRTANAVCFLQVP